MHTQQTGMEEGKLREGRKKDICRVGRYITRKRRQPPRRRKGEGKDAEETANKIQDATQQDQTEGEGRSSTANDRRPQEETLREVRKEE